MISENLKIYFYKNINVKNNKLGKYKKVAIRKFMIGNMDCNGCPGLH